MKERGCKAVKSFVKQMIVVWFKSKKNMKSNGCSNLIGVSYISEITFFQASIYLPASSFLTCQ